MLFVLSIHGILCVCILSCFVLLLFPLNFIISFACKIILNCNIKCSNIHCLIVCFFFRSFSHSFICSFVLCCIPRGIQSFSISYRLNSICRKKLNRYKINTPKIHIWLDQYIDKLKTQIDWYTLYVVCSWFSSDFLFVRLD